MILLGISLYISALPPHKYQVVPIDLSVFADSTDTNIVLVWKPVLSC